MFLRFNFSRAFALSVIVLSLCVFAFADTVRLKDGSIVKGRVVGFRDGQFVILIGDGARQRQMTYYSDEISAIEFDSSANTAVNQKPNNSNTIVTIPVQNQMPSVTPTNNSNIDNGNPVNNPQIINSNTAANNRPKPIQISAKVLADNTSNGWTNTGWVVKKGQKIRISGTGRISIGNGRYTTPSGVASLADTEKLMKDKPTGGMIAVVGDDNNDFIFVGSAVEFTAKRDGSLFLGVNEGYLDDNSGAFEVVVEIDPTTND